MKRHTQTALRLVSEILAEEGDETEFTNGSRGKYPGLGPAQCATVFDREVAPVEFLRDESRHFLEIALTMKDDRLAVLLHRVMVYLVEGPDL